MSTEFSNLPVASDAWRARARSGEVSASEPVWVFATKSLLYPVIPAVTLLICLLAWGEPLYGPYILVGVIAFLGVADLLDSIALRITPASAMALRCLVDITLRWGVLMVFVYVLLKLSNLGHYFHEPMMWTWVLTTPLALWCGELLAQHLLLRRAAHPTSARRAVIVGATPRALQLADTLSSQPALGVAVSGFFDDRAAERLPSQEFGECLGDLSVVSQFVSRQRIDIVYITLPMVPHPRILELLSSLRNSTASIYFVPDLSVFDLVQPRFDIVDGIPVIAVCESPFYGVHGIVKRLSDIVVSSAALLLLSPLLLAVAVAVRWDSPGPIIYRQKRYGLDGREIIVYKFRSLRVVEDGVQSYTQVARNDVRLTRFGAFIRRTSIDELPQLFNVLLGNMSIVGPRPHAVAVNENYRHLIPGYMVRHKVKPGITGWAQVNGYRGGDDLDSMTQRINFDLEYLRHWSLGFDVIIMLKTATLIWKDSHAY